jgi:HEAT repeat protein
MRTLSLALLIASLGAVPATGAAQNVAYLSGSDIAHVALLGGEDPADSIFQLAQRALNRSEYRQAATLFERVATRYPRSARAPEALYFQAFALYKVGERRELKSALAVLDRLQDRYPKDSQKGDASSLKVRVCGELAQRGDEACASEVTSIATATATTSTSTATTSTSQGRRCPDDDDENDERIMALNALLTMDSERALPILEGIMRRRDQCAVLRRKAVFLISQKHSTRAADILIQAIRDDPDEEVRKQAVFWLAQTRDARVPGVLRDLVRNGSRELQKNAVFSLSQLGGGQGDAALRDLAASDNTAEEIRSEAIFWLGQKHSSENGQFLRDLFKRVRSGELKDKIIFSLSQQRGTGSEQWLLDIAMDANESTEVRKQALFWAAQNKSIGFDRLSALYDRTNDTEIKEQLIFGFSQRNSREAVDKLMSIARSDRDKEMRKKAIFWLGQSRDPRVLDFLAEMIGK